MADNPQQTLRELKDLIVTYVKQETIDPIKGLGRYIAFGVGGAFLMGTGVVFVAIGILRALQTETGRRLTDNIPFTSDNLSWVPYFVVLVILAAGAALSWALRGKRKKKQAA